MFSQPLRVGIDGRAFTSAAGGIRRYLDGLVPALQTLEHGPEIVGLGGDPQAMPPGVAHIGEPPHPPTNAGWTLVGIPRAARRAGVDLIHAPAYTAPRWAGVPVVLTVHDVSYELHPEWYPYRRDWLRRAFYRSGARAAAEILTVSAFSAGEIVKAYGVPRERITVTPLGVTPAFGTAEQSGLPSGVAPPFVLHVGDLHERRNLALALDAVIGARRQGGAAARLSLVLAGIDRGVVAALVARAAEAGIPEAVNPLGVVPERDLHALYRRAAALVYPSRYEGFGLPIIEAMASGTPVIGSRAASIPEVLGDAGILLDPDDVPGWTVAIVDVVSRDSTRERLAAAGQRRAAGFTWDRTARATMEVYRRVAGQRRQA